MEMLSLHPSVALRHFSPKSSISKFILAFWSITDMPIRCEWGNHQFVGRELMKRWSFIVRHGKVVSWQLQTNMDQLIMASVLRLISSFAATARLTFMAWSGDFRKSNGFFNWPWFLLPYVSRCLPCFWHLEMIYSSFVLTREKFFIEEAKKG